MEKLYFNIAKKYDSINNFFLKHIAQTLCELMHMLITTLSKRENSQTFGKQARLKQSIKTATKINLEL